MVKIVAICIVLGVLIVYLRSINPEIAMLASVCAGTLILIEAFTYLTETFTFINALIEQTKIDADLFKIIFKAVGIGYLIEFGAGILEDFGLKSLADKLILLGKIIILSISLPLLYAIFNIISDLIK